MNALIEFSLRHHVLMLVLFVIVPCIIRMNDSLTQGRPLPTESFGRVLGSWVPAFAERTEIQWCCKHKFIVL
jgi:hypothetical protein